MEGTGTQLLLRGPSSGMFTNPRTKKPLLAWFSKNMEPGYRDLWVLHGGKAVSTTKAIGIEYFFATSPHGFQTRRLIERKNTVVYDPLWIVHSLTEQSRRPLGPYVLANHKFSESHENLPLAEPTPGVPPHEDVNEKLHRTGAAATSATPPREVAELEPEYGMETVKYVDVEDDYCAASGSPDGVGLLVRAVDFGGLRGNPYGFEVVLSSPAT